MKHMFLGAMLMLALLSPLGTAQAAPACPSTAPAQLVEVFVSADCASCWRQRTNVHPQALRLDWIVPGEQGDDAPLSAAAVAEANDRMKTALAKDAASVQAHPPTHRPVGLSLTADSGLAWNGYIALVLEMKRRNGKALSADAEGWIALVERVPAGEDGAPEDRQLVRKVIGPLPMDLPAGQHELRHLRAVQLPADVQVERLGAVGWIEDRGRIVGLTQSVPANCQPSRH